MKPSRLKVEQCEGKVEQISLDNFSDVKNPVAAAAAVLPSQQMTQEQN